MNELQETMPFGKRYAIHNQLCCYLSSLAFFPAVIIYAALQLLEAVYSSRAESSTPVFDWAFDWGLIVLISLYGIYSLRGHYFRKDTYSFFKLLSQLNSIVSPDTKLDSDELQALEKHLDAQHALVHIVVLMYALIFACFVNHVVFVVITALLWQWKFSIDQKKQNTAAE